MAAGLRKMGRSGNVRKRAASELAVFVTELGVGAARIAATWERSAEIG